MFIFVNCHFSQKMLVTIASKTIVLPKKIKNITGANIGFFYNKEFSGTHSSVVLKSVFLPAR